MAPDPSDAGRGTPPLAFVGIAGSPYWNWLQDIPWLEPLPWPLGPRRNLLALSAGALHTIALREIMRANEEAKSDHPQAMRAGVHRLEAEQVITEHEAAQIREIIHTISSDAELEQVVERLNNVYHGLVREKERNSVALAIASIAVETAVNAKGDRIAFARVGDADVGGAIAGAAVGGTIGSFVGGDRSIKIGATIGAIIGGAVASAAASKRG